MVTIHNKLEILPGENGGWILLPGCEPSSALTSTTLFSQIKEQDLCNCSVVPVDKALDAIPGSSVEIILNMGGHTSGRRLFVLPQFEQFGCDPCKGQPDWYAVLRELCEPIEEEEEPICDDFGLGECSSRSFGGGTPGVIHDIRGEYPEAPSEGGLSI